MPSWLLPVINALGPTLLKMALKLLNSKYPGLSPIINEVLKWIDGEPNKEVAVTTFKDCLRTTARLPDTVRL